MSEEHSLGCSDLFLVKGVPEVSDEKRAKSSEQPILCEWKARA